MIRSNRVSSRPPESTSMTIPYHTTLCRTIIDTLQDHKRPFETQQDLARPNKNIQGQKRPKKTYKTTGMKKIPCTSGGIFLRILLVPQCSRSGNMYISVRIKEHRRTTSSITVLRQPKGCQVGSQLRRSLTSCEYDTTVVSMTQQL